MVFHLTEPESDLWRERLAFRDALRDDATLAAEYELLKRRLAQKHREDDAAYRRQATSSPVCWAAAGFN
jgi:GrpB-like predicted nucleotidyltransferase (UPF0157 family)